jgi:putative PIN family toxin of toxin-antitoxin system
VIVLDASTIIGAVIRRGSVPDRAVRHAFATDRVAVSDEVLAELVDVLYRPKLARFINPGLRDDVLWLFDTEAVSFTPTERVFSCRDPKDNIYLELASTAGAEAIVSSDGDLLALHPWRGVRILRPAEYLAETRDGP